jgi:hypothetical protein
MITSASIQTDERSRMTVTPKVRVQDAGYLLDSASGDEESISEIHVADHFSSVKSAVQSWRRLQVSKKYITVSP